MYCLAVKKTSYLILCFELRSQSSLYATLDEVKGWWKPQRKIKALSDTDYYITYELLRLPYIPSLLLGKYKQLLHIDHNQLSLASEMCVAFPHTKHLFPAIRPGCGRKLSRALAIAWVSEMVLLGDVSWDKIRECGRGALHLVWNKNLIPARWYSLSRNVSVKQIGNGRNECIAFGTDMKVEGSFQFSGPEKFTLLVCWY